MFVGFLQKPKKSLSLWKQNTGCGEVEKRKISLFFYAKMPDSRKQVVIHFLSWGEVTRLYLPRFLMFHIMVKDVLECVIIREEEKDPLTQ